MALNTTELRQQRAKIVEEMRNLHEQMIENGSETPEEADKFGKMESDIRALEKVIEREETLQKEEAENARVLDAQRDLKKRNGNGNGNGTAYNPSLFASRYAVPDIRKSSEAEIERRMPYALQGWLGIRKPGFEIQEEHIQAARFFGFNLEAREIDLPIRKNYRQFRNEHRNMSLSAAAGGYTVPAGFVNNLEAALLAFGGMRQVADVMRTDSGTDLPWPTMNDTTNKGEIIAEAASFGNSVDPSFGSLVFKAFKYSSKAIIVSSELLQDSAFNLSDMIGTWLGERIGRIQNDHFTTGAGTTLPKGVVVASIEGKEAASQTAITSDEVIDLEHSVDPSYRPGARWMMHDNILAAIRKLKESTTNAYIWQPGLQAGVPDRLLGYEYTVNQSMASSQAQSAKILLFGQFMKYKIRDVASVRLVRLDELFAQTDQVGFVAFLRSDGNLLDAGTAPIKHLTNKKT